MPNRSEPERFKVLLMSDSTGETVSASARAAVSQYGALKAEYDLHPFIRTLDDVAAIPERCFMEADIAFFTIMDGDVRAAIRIRASQAELPAISVLDPLLDGITEVLNRPPSARPGQQYQVDRVYLDRVAAIDYAISHDDGLSDTYLKAADVILVGVSRTSKTPTCIYLGYQGIKAANVPFIINQSPPPALFDAIASGIPVVGLTASPSRLVQVRQSRLGTLGTEQMEKYSDRAHIEEELVQARFFFERHAIPIIDVTRRSIEETAASIRQVISRRT